MGKNKLLDTIDRLSKQQVERLTEIALEYLDLNTELEDTTPKSCPCCGDANARFIKRGHSVRKQRYQCKSCGKRFTFDAGKLTAHSHQTEEAWTTFIRDTLSLKSLDECAANISVSHPTSFYMRHKLLSFLEEAFKRGELLEGVIEADEAYVQESQKGILVTTRKPRKHGETATKRGLSNEHFCVCVPQICHPCSTRYNIPKFRFPIPTGAQPPPRRKLSWICRFCLCSRFTPRLSEPILRP